jgi:putative restriction endonuclease
MRFLRPVLRARIVSGTDPPDPCGMILDYDLRLRFAVLELIERLRREHGGLVPSNRLNEGIQFEGQRVPIWNQQRGIYKPATLGRDGAALTIQTSFRDPYEDRLNPDDDRLLYRYQGRDPQHADNRAMRRALERGRPLLYLVAVRQALYQPIYPCYVVGDVPEQLTFLLIADESRHITPATSVDEDWPRKAYVTREVKQRLHQQRFRYMVLDAYRGQCAMCQLRHVELLDAAHILPDRDERGNPEVPNGVSLCNIHHRAYDVNILGVDADYRIHIRDDVLREIDGPMLRHGLQELDGQRITVPRSSPLRPRRDYLAERFDRFRAA